MNKKIAFHSNQIGLRGTEVALYDYALNNQEILGNKSYILYDENSVENNVSAVEKFKKKFDVIGYKKFSDVDGILRETESTLLYAIKSGFRDGVISSVVPTAVHSVFPSRYRDIHGEKFAYISEWLSDTFSNKKIPFVPHIVNSPVQCDISLREELGIPNNAIVFGCHGGATSFDITFVKEAIAEIVRDRSDIYFLFLNIERFICNKQVYFFPGTSELTFKEMFINSCDAMIHARGVGETFGLACAEFSIRNKPVITYAYSPQTMHIKALKKTAFLYRNKQEVMKIFHTFDKLKYSACSWDCYSDRYNPKTVMKNFNDIFIENSDDKKINIEIGDRVSVLKNELKYKARMAYIKISGIMHV